MQNLPICASLKNGESGWLLKWNTGGPIPVKNSYWFEDVDEAMCVRLAMQLGDTFEKAFEKLWSGELDMKAAAIRREEKYTWMKETKRLRDEKHRAETHNY